MKKRYIFILFVIILTIAYCDMYDSIKALNKQISTNPYIVNKTARPSQNKVNDVLKFYFKKQK